MTARPMHPEFTKAIIGYIGAGFSVGAGFLAQALPKEIEGWGQVGAFGMLVYFLVYAVKHQNAEAREERTKRETEARRWEDKWAAEHKENLDAREKDRETRDKLADAVTSLADAVKK